MNYYEFLNKKFATQGMSEGYTLSSSSKATNPFKQGVFKSDSSAVQFPQGSIFTSASKEDLKNVDFNKVLGSAGSQTPVEISPLEYILKEFFALGNVKKDADSNGDGEVSVEEAQLYVNKLAAKDGNGEDLTLQDFEEIIREKGIDLDAISNFLQQASEKDGAGAVETPASAETQVADQSAQSNDSAPVVAPAHSNKARFCHGFHQLSSSVSDTELPTLKPVDLMSLSELRSEKSKREKILTEKRHALISAKMGDEEVIQDAKHNVEHAFRKYEKALKIDKYASKYSAAVKNNQNQIKANEQAINKNDAAITAKQGEITDCEASISFSEEVISGLESSLQGIEDTEDNQQAAVQKALINKQIAAKKRELEEQKARLEKLQGELSALNDTENTLNEQKSSLQTAKTGIEDRIKAVASALTKQAMKKLQESMQAYVRAKSRLTKTAEQELKAAEASVQEINQKIAVKEVEDSNKAKAEEQNDGGVGEALQIATAQDSAASNISSQKSDKKEKYSYTDLLYGVDKGSSNSANPASEQSIKQQATAAGCYADKNSGYKPQEGDLAMLTSTSTSGNVGVVTAVFADGSFEVSEGTAGNSVAKHHYKSTKEATNCNGFVQMSKWKNSGIA